MNERPCIRCQNPVLLEDGHLVYCSQCGAPQIFLSRELEAEIAQQAEHFQQRTAPQPPLAEPPEPRRRRWRPSTHQQPWPMAVQYALISAGVALVLGLLTLLLPAASVLLLFWAAGAPILTVGLFIAHSMAGPRVSPGFAARLGLLTGLLVGFAGAVVSSVNLLLARFVQHDTAAFDAQLDAVFAQQRTVLLQRMGAAAQPTLNLLAVPEFRVGLLLCMVATSAALYLFLSAVAAGLTGAILGRRRAA